MCLGENFLATEMMLVRFDYYSNLSDFCCMLHKINFFDYKDGKLNLKSSFCIKVTKSHLMRIAGRSYRHIHDLSVKFRLLYRTVFCVFVLNRPRCVWCGLKLSPSKKMYLQAFSVILHHHHDDEEFDHKENNAFSCKMRTVLCFYKKEKELNY